MTEVFQTTLECNGEAHAGNAKKTDPNGIFCDDDDQSASSLFESFMEIVNDPSLRDENKSGVKLEDSEGTVTELAPSSVKTIIETDACNNNYYDLTLAESAGNDVEKEIESNLGRDHSGETNEISMGLGQSKALEDLDRTQQPTLGREDSGENYESSIGVRLSRAVDDLDGLQERLTFMMASFQDQPSETENVEGKLESVGGKSRIAGLENGESFAKEATNEADSHMGSGEEEESTEKNEVSSMILKQTSGCVSRQNQCDNEETAEKQLVDGGEQENRMQANTVETSEIENDEESCGGGSQTDEQSVESTDQKDKEVTDEGSAAVQPRTTDVHSTDDVAQNDKDSTCEMTPNKNTQLDYLPTTSPEISASGIHASADMPEKDNSEYNLGRISSSNTVPGIEINTAYESSGCERKSLDSLDLEQSSHSSSQTASPALSDEGIDSDSRSDCGDDGNLDPETLQSSRPKSWYLEVALRDSLHSDSSTEGEWKEAKQRESTGSGRFTRASSLGEVLIRGHLLKLGGSGLKPKSWKKRWFVLKRDNCLYYYKQSNNKDSLGVIVLANYSISKAVEVNKKYCFRLNKGGARTYHLCAADEGDMRKWMMALNNALRRAAEVDNNSFQISETNVHNVSIPALSIRDPDCHGYLSKLGQSKIKTWKRRYCVLKNGYLYYYTDMSNATALGVAKLLGYMLRKGAQQGKRFCFYAVPPEDSLRTYFFAVDSERDQKRWMSRLESSIRKGEGVASDD